MDGSGMAATLTRALTERPLDFDPDQWTAQATADWLAAHPGYLTGFEEQWVAVVGPWVVAHSPDLSEAAERARQLGVDNPLWVPVPPPGDLIY